MTTTLTTYRLPAYWASYLINGDASGLESGERATIDAWLAREGGPNIVDCGDSYFSRHNESGNGMAGDVCEYTALQGGLGRRD